MLERYKSLIFGGIVLVILAGIIVLLAYRPPPTVLTIISPPPTVTPAPSPTPGPLHVYVTGAVLRANLLHALPPGSRVADAIRAAGGFGPEADQAAVNLAQLLRDGEQIHVPTLGERRAATAGGSSTTSAKASPADPVHINTADQQELQRLPGVGPVLSGAILAYREQHGPFRQMADLDPVPGVGPARLQQWEGLIVFD